MRRIIPILAFCLFLQGDKARAQGLGIGSGLGGSVAIASISVNGLNISPSTVTVTSSVNGCLVAGSTAIWADCSNLRLGVNISTPATTLDVNGISQFGSGTTKSTFSATGALSLSSATTFNGVGNIVWKSTQAGNGANILQIQDNRGNDIFDILVQGSGTRLKNPNAGAANIDIADVVYMNGINVSAGSTLTGDVTLGGKITGTSSGVFNGSFVGSVQSTGYGSFGGPLTVNGSSATVNGDLAINGSYTKPFMATSSMTLSSTNLTLTGSNGYISGSSSITTTGLLYGGFGIITSTLTVQGTAFSVSSTVFAVTSGGSVGVGTGSPGAKFHVSGGAVMVDNGQGLNALNASGSAINWFVFDSGNNTQFHSGSGGSEKARLDSSGNFGVGTTSPVYPLDISGTGRFTTGLVSAGPVSVLGSSTTLNGDVKILGSYTAPFMTTSSMTLSNTNLTLTGANGYAAGSSSFTTTGGVFGGYGQFGSGVNLSSFTVNGHWIPTQKTAVQIDTLVPDSIGDVIECVNCTEKYGLCHSTGILAAQWQAQGTTRGCGSGN